jgi:hypothetical protein
MPYLDSRSLELVAAGIEATRGGLRDVREAIERARADATASEEVVLSILAIYQAHIELAAGLVYAQQDRIHSARECWGRAHRCAERQNLTARHREVRNALAPLERALALLPSLDGTNALSPDQFDGWMVDVDCARFRPRGGQWVSLERRHALRRIALALVTERVNRPGAAVPQMDLIEYGWPGERTLRAAALNRLHFSLVSLRKLGWASILQTRQQAYRLDPTVPLLLLNAPPMELSA